MRLDRSYFELQARFAERVAAIDGLDLAEACRLHTAFYALARDNDAGVAPERNDFDPAHPAWAAFADAVAHGTDPAAYAYQAYLDGDAAEEQAEETRRGPQPCFAFTYWPEDRLVRIHFSNDATGTALRPENIEERCTELRAIFETIAAAHPEAETVRGTSWLYHLDAYRRLFPAPFLAGLVSAGHPHQFAALWCQFIDRHGVVKPHLATPFLRRIEHATTTVQLDQAFPLDVLTTSADVRVFYEHYGVDEPARRNG